jgi:hypothetical protein
MAESAYHCLVVPVKVSERFNRNIRHSGWLLAMSHDDEVRLAQYVASLH